MKALVFHINYDGICVLFARSFAQNCNQALFWGLKSQVCTRPEPGIHFFKPDLDPQAKFTEWVKICATAGYWWRCSGHD